MKRWIGLALGLALLAAAPADATGLKKIKVMTRNQYLGADLTPVILAQTPAEFIAAATAALTQIAANDFPTRAAALAKEVRNTRPDVIGLQEVFDFSVNGLHVGPPFVDHLQATLAALAAEGLSYAVAATVEHLDVTVPIDVFGDPAPEAVRVLDRDVILVRSGIPFTALGGSYLSGGLCGVPIPNPVPVPPFPATLQSTPSEDGCNYTVIATVSSPVGTIAVERGFVGVDVTVGGRKYRVVDTHLEVRSPNPVDPSSAIIQMLQSVELAGTLVATTPANRTLIALGDYNSAPDDAPIGPIVPPYQVMAAAGFADVWDTNLLKVFDPDGFTCCQLSDLSNLSSLHDERIDLVLLKGGGPVLPIALVTGHPIRLLEPPPHWGSDHGGVFADLVFFRPF
jgi:endonuclease/exonuclease/phosphatase family metal-dependent hydrolase